LDFFFAAYPSDITTVRSCAGCFCVSASSCCVHLSTLLHGAYASQQLTPAFAGCQTTEQREGEKKISVARLIYYCIRPATSPPLTLFVKPFDLSAYSFFHPNFSFYFTLFLIRESPTLSPPSTPVPFGPLEGRTKSCDARRPPSIPDSDLNLQGHATNGRPHTYLGVGKHADAFSRIQPRTRRRTGPAYLRRSFDYCYFSCPAIFFSFSSSFSSASSFRRFRPRIAYPRGPWLSAESTSRTKHMTDAPAPRQHSHFATHVHYGEPGRRG
jgi:hypothetical protein